MVSGNSSGSPGNLGLPASITMECLGELTSASYAFEYSVTGILGSKGTGSQIIGAALTITSMHPDRNRITDGISEQTKRNFLQCNEWWKRWPSATAVPKNAS